MCLKNKERKIIRRSRIIKQGWLWKSKSWRYLMLLDKRHNRTHHRWRDWLYLTRPQSCFRSPTASKRCSYVGALEHILARTKAWSTRALRSPAMHTIWCREEARGTGWTSMNNNRISSVVWSVRTSSRNRRWSKAANCHMPRTQIWSKTSSKAWYASQH